MKNLNNETSSIDRQETPVPELAGSQIPVAIPLDLQLPVPERYEILEELGAGGMGVVYKAHDRYLDQKVSIKILKTRGDLELLTIRFQREAKALSRLHHKNLATVLDFGTTGKNDFYMVSKYIEAITLKEFMKTQNQLEVVKALKIIAQIADCMRYVHEKGILHRDLKSSNILLNENAQEIDTFVIDFGIAKLDNQDQLKENLTQTGLIIGTPEYMSPEQAEGLEVDQRSDIYSLGCIAFELLTGKLPFSGTSSLDLLYKKMESPDPSLHDAITRDDIPEELISLVEKMLKKNPDSRIKTMVEVYTSCQSMLEAFESQKENEKNSQSVKNNSHDSLLSSIEKPKPGKFFITKEVRLFFCLAGFGLIAFLIHSISRPNKASEEPVLSSTKSVKSLTNLKNVAAVTRYSRSPEFVHERVKKVLAGVCLDEVSLTPGLTNRKIDWKKMPRPEGDFYLNVLAMPLSKSDLTEIVKIPGLRGLAVTRFQSDSDNCFRLICSQRKLIWLKIHCLQVSPESIKELSSLSELRFLQAIHCELNTDKVKALPDLNKVSTFNIKDDSFFNDKDLEILLSKLPNLRNLYIENCNIKGTTLRSLAKLKKLETLTLPRNKIGDQAIDNIVQANLPIKLIDLTNTLITRRGFANLNKLKSLETVLVSDCKNFNQYEIEAYKNAMHFETTGNLEEEQCKSFYFFGSD